MESKVIPPSSRYQQGNSLIRYFRKYLRFLQKFVLSTPKNLKHPDCIAALEPQYCHSSLFSSMGTVTWDVQRLAFLYSFTSLGR